MWKAARPDPDPHPAANLLPVSSGIKGQPITTPNSLTGQPLPGLALAEREPDQLALLDGGEEAYPAMIAAIDGARESVYLEVYLFRLDSTGRRFLAALAAAAARKLRVEVLVDGWGSSSDCGEIVATLGAAGAQARVHRPVGVVFAGLFGRNHRKILLIDSALAFVGGINIGDEYGGESNRPGWADLAAQVRGPAAQDLALELRGGRPLARGNVQIRLSGVGTGRRLRKRYLKAIRGARREVLLAHGYFLPDRELLRALTSAAGRGVQVTALLAGRSDVPFVPLATRHVHRRLLQGGVKIFEWSQTVLHAKAAVIDGQKLLVGSFNLDALSLSNMETLLEADDAALAGQGARWMRGHLALARAVSFADCTRPGLRGFLEGAIGFLFAQLGEWVEKLLAQRGRPQR